MSLINAHADISSKTRGLNFGLSIYQLPYFNLYASSKGSGDSAQMRDWSEPLLLADVISMEISCCGPNTYSTPVDSLNP